MKSALVPLLGFGARIALDSGKRFDSASRYIEDRGDEPTAARKSSKVNRKYKTKYRVNASEGTRIGTPGLWIGGLPVEGGCLH